MSTRFYLFVVHSCLSQYVTRRGHAVRWDGAAKCARKWSQNDIEVTLPYSIPTGCAPPGTRPVPPASSSLWSGLAEATDFFSTSGDIHHCILSAVARGISPGCRGGGVGGAGTGAAVVSGGAGTGAAVASISSILALSAATLVLCLRLFFRHRHSLQVHGASARDRVRW